MEGATIIAALVGLVSAVITSIIGYFVQQSRLRTEFDQDLAGVRTKYMAEDIAIKLLNNKNYRRRSFSAIQRRIGGFSEKELQQILIRAGAIRFIGKSVKEYWGLISLNEDGILTDAEKKIKVQENTT